MGREAALHLRDEEQRLLERAFVTAVTALKGGKEAARKNGGKEKNQKDGGGGDDNDNGARGGGGGKGTKRKEAPQMGASYGPVVYFSSAQAK